MAALNPPASTATVDVPDEHVDRYVAAGWVRVADTKTDTEVEEKPRPVKRSPRKKSS